MESNILLVEGTSDKWFFTALLKNMPITVEVYPPAEANESTRGNGIENLLDTLPILLKQLSNGQRQCLAIVIDADSQQNQCGYSIRRERIKYIIESKSAYRVASDGDSKLLQGEFFTHTESTSAPVVGLWVMPNHQDDGMLEDFLLPCIEQPERKHVLKIVDNSLSQLSNEIADNIRFSKTHENKVKFSTWLNWQKKPNRCRNLSPACAFTEGWINSEHKNIQAIKKWLEHVFDQ